MSKHWISGQMKDKDVTMQANNILRVDDKVNIVCLREHCQAHQISLV